MTTAAPHAAAPTADVKEAPVAKKGRFASKKIKIIAAVVVVMALQAVAAMFLLPKGHGTTATGHAAETAHGGHSSDEPHGGKWENFVEAEIGEFSCSIELDDGILWHVSLKLFSAVDSNAQTHFAEAVNERYKARVRQAVVKVIRMSSIADLRDPQLDLVKRNLKTEINNVLPERYIHEIIISEIHTMQQ